MNTVNYVDDLRNRKADVSIYLINGIRIIGRIAGHDADSLFVERSGEPAMLVCWPAISSIVPEKWADRRSFEGPLPQGMPPSVLSRPRS